MREILFRGKTESSERWVVGDLLQWSDGEMCICENRNHFEKDKYRVIPETVGQYTGLTGKNGKRIFEGDVVKAYDDTYDNGFAEVKGKVFFNCGSFDIDVEDVGYIPLYSYGTKNIEVVGNIHDNPELLKGDKSDA